MADIIVFPLRLRSPDAPGVDRGNALIPFPFSRRRHLVERHARAMRRLSEDDGEAYITRVLEGVCEELRGIGIHCENCENDAILDLADAIGKQLHGPNFVLKIEGGAE